MRILFLTMGRFKSIEAHSLYADLLRCFRNNGHEICVIAPGSESTDTVLNESRCTVVNVNISEALSSNNLVKKGLSQIKIEISYKSAIKKYFSNIKFDIILYSTPPITFCEVIKFVKKRDNAKTYLLLKDIFPQNAVDLGMMRKSGLKGIIYKYFRNKEKKLYAISDYIGCMSQANVKYVLKNNPEIEASKVEICPNSIEFEDKSILESERIAMREKYKLPIDKKIFVYGGNLGRPQGVPFIIECLRAEKDNSEAFFVIVGKGTEYEKIENFANAEKPQNMRLMKQLPKEDYDQLVAACDVGMIFLDYRFTIPNFPSRLLSYMQAGIPVLACTDRSTDVGDIVESGGFGWSSESNSVKSFSNAVKRAIATCGDGEMKKNEFSYLTENYSVEKGYKIVMKHF